MLLLSQTKLLPLVPPYLTETQIYKSEDNYSRYKWITHNLQSKKDIFTSVYPSIELNLNLFFPNLF